MKPEIWGPHAWIFLHSITLTYPDTPTSDDKKNMADFFSTLMKVLPCQKCQSNFGQHFAEYPLTDDILSSKAKLIKWLIDVHNAVNRMNNKEVLSHEESLRRLLCLLDKKDTTTDWKKTKSILLWAIVTTVTILIIVAVAMAIRKM